PMSREPSSRGLQAWEGMSCSTMTRSEPMRVSRTSSAVPESCSPHRSPHGKEWRSPCRRWQRRHDMMTALAGGPMLDSAPLSMSRLSLLVDLGSLLAREVDFDALLATACERLAEALRADRATIWLVDAERGDL